MRRGRLGPVLVLVLGLSIPCATAQGAPDWAPAATATIHPGVAISESPENPCTANFVFYDAHDVYLGTAAHCIAEPLDSFESLCGGKSAPYGTAVGVQGARRPATLVYSSWRAMQEAGIPATDEMCVPHDFALLRLDRSDHGSVNPSVPVWGGPSGLRPLGPMAIGERVVAYVNSGTRMEMDAIKPLEGVGELDWESGWRHDVQFVTPAIPGDSGSAALDNAGSAFGVVTTLRYAPPGATGVTDLARSLAFMRAHTALKMRLAEGTEPFTGTGDALAPAPAGGPDPQPEESSPAPAPAPAPVSAPPPPATPTAGPPRPRPAVTKTRARCPKGKVRRRVRGSKRTRCVKIRRPARRPSARRR